MENRFLDYTALTIAVIGALNWGAIGLFGFDLVAFICGGQMAALSGLLGQGKEESHPAVAEGGDLTQAILRMAPLLGSLREETDGTRLLHALRPLLSPSRRQRLDQAVRLMQLMRVLPLLKSSGLF